MRTTTERKVATGIGFRAAIQDNMDSSRPSINLQQFDIELQGRVCWDPGLSFAAVRHLGGNVDASLAADRHAGDADVPTFDDLATAKGEFERCAFLVC